MEFKKKKLKNGIVVLMERRELPVVSVSISNRFGAGFEHSKVKGIAHFIEHLLFTGTNSRTHEEISAEIEKKGGIINAFTDHDVTSFWFKLPSEHLFTGLSILADMLNHPTFDKDKFDKEKKVVLEEIKLYHDNPQRCVFDQIEANLYGKPFGEGIVGSSQSVSSLTRDFVAEYYHKNYNPANFIVTIVGDADFVKVCRFLEKHFKPKKAKPSEPRIIFKNSESVEERQGIDQANFVFAAHAPLPMSRDYYAMLILNNYLADGMSSKLFLEIREKRGLAYNVQGSINSGKKYCYYTIYVGATKESLPEIKSLILNGFEKVRHMTDNELKEIKETLVGLKKISSEESANVMNNLMYSELFTKAEDYYNYDNLVRKVSLNQVKRLAKKILQGYSTVAIVPK